MEGFLFKQMNLDRLPLALLDVREGHAGTAPQPHRPRDERPPLDGSQLAHYFGRRGRGG